MSRWVILYLFLADIAFAQSKSGGVDFFYDVLGKKGLLTLIAIIFFAYSYKNSVKLFAWIEDQTYGTQDYVLQKLELLFIEIKPQ